MTRTRVATRQRALRALALALLTLLVLVAGAPAASAHTQLISSDPADGAVLPAGPRTITFTFDEAVTLPPRAVQLFDATGAAVAVQVSGHDAVLTATVPRLADGTYVAAWRVISDDGHPVAGSIRFSVSKPSAVVRPPSLTPATDPAVHDVIGVAGGLNYLALFLAGGLVLFIGWVVAGTRLEPRTGRRLVLLAWVASAVAIVTAALLVTSHGAEDLGQGIGGIGHGDSLALRFVGGDVLVLCLEATGLLSALLFLGDRWAASGAALVAVAAPVAVGHARDASPVWLAVGADVVHLVAGATWLGGLVGLALVLGSLGARDAAAVLSRFSTLGALTLGALVVTGTIAVWRILGSWSALVHTGYGQLLLVKIGVVALVAAVAGANRFLLLPRVRRGEGIDVRQAALRVRTAVRCEALLLVVVLGLTGFLVGLSPR